MTKIEKSIKLGTDENAVEITRAMDSNYTEEELVQQLENFGFHRVAKYTLPYETLYQYNLSNRDGEAIYTIHAKNNNL